MEPRHVAQLTALSAIFVVAMWTSTLAQFGLPKLPKIPGVDRLPRPSGPPSPPPAAPVAPPAAPTVPSTVTRAESTAPFVGVEATAIVDRASRPATLAPSYGRKFAAANTLSQVVIANPYMDPAKPLFEKPMMQCRLDGGLILGGHGGFDSDGRMQGLGYWSVAPDGAVRPLHVRGVTATVGSGFSRCNAPFAQTNLSAGAFGLARDGRLLATSGAAVMAIGPSGFVEHLAGSDGECARDGSGTAGNADGPASVARFDGPRAPVEDGSGALWFSDQKGCALRRIARDGTTSTVLGPDVLCNDKLPPESQPRLDTLAWDAAHGELVAGGSLTVAVPVHDLYTMVWRIKPSGEAKRVLWAKKASRVSPAGVHLDGVSALSVDAAGQVYILTQQMMLFERRGFDAFQLMKLDEGRQTAVAVSGTKIRAGTWMPEHPFDGPLDQAHFRAPTQMCFAPSGALFVADDILIRKVDLKGSVVTWVF